MSSYQRVSAELSYPLYYPKCFPIRKDCVFLLTLLEKIYIFLRLEWLRRHYTNVRTNVRPAFIDLFCFCFTTREQQKPALKEQ